MPGLPGTRGLPSSTASAWPTADQLDNVSQWTFRNTSLLFPRTLVSTRVTGFDSDGLLSGLSAATVCFETEPTQAPNRNAVSSRRVFSTREHGDLYSDLSPQGQVNADDGNNGRWAGPNSAVPEPGALALAGLALAGLWLTRRRA